MFPVQLARHPLDFVSHIVTYADYSRPQHLLTGILPLCDVVQRRIGSVKKIREQLQCQKLLLSTLIVVLLFVMQRVSTLQLVLPSVGQPSVGSGRSLPSRICSGVRGVVIGVMGVIGVTVVDPTPASDLTPTPTPTPTPSFAVRL